MVDPKINDIEWWPHRYDEKLDRVHYVQASRDDHRSATFLTDEYLPHAAKPSPIKMGEAVNGVKSEGEAPLHFIFHSAYCCSTLLARAYDVPGQSMGLKEPMLLNDIKGIQSRGAQPQQVLALLDGVLTLLSRPFETGEAVIVKPSNVVNFFAGHMLNMRPNAHALFLYAPLEEFLVSIARKGLWGRHWVRDLMLKQLKDGLVQLGIKGDEFLMLTDIQVAAVGWLTQHLLFQRLIQSIGSARVKTLNSKKLLSDPKQVMKVLNKHFNVAMTDDQLEALVTGPVFTKHSKTASDYSAEKRETERKRGADLHAEEVEKVVHWAQTIAQSANVSLEMPAPLVK
ncbi:hypothetical protein QGN29_06860 [Temperatibacter marinus]|uniref:Uncharacterized protein n=1 Tax=Temperatibacter marinus TaxID=1456591 RepID=A0AA52EI66_9PROT|nr:hypothetical protein [Temperatibacter marinus]WND04093.1 hypothetical protein QGN29_06860 [Temperatibacter marinus]